MWVIRGGEKDQMVDPFVDQGVIGVAFPQVPDAEILTRTEIHRLLREDHPKGTLDAQVDMLAAFVREIQVGDSVLMPDTGRDEVIVGTITGRYEFHGDLVPDAFRHRRTVTWLARHAIADLPAAVRGAAKQRPTLQQHRDAEWSGYLVDVRDQTIGRDPADRRARTASTTPRRARAAAAPRVIKPVVVTQTCASCFLQTHPDRMRGTICADCAE